MGKIKIGLIILGSIALAGLVFGGVVMAKNNSNNSKAEYVQDEIIVKFKGDVKPFRVLKVPEGKVGEKINEYRGKKEVEYAEPNYIAYAQTIPNDPYYKYQWHLDNAVYGGIQMEEAWGISSGQGVTVAVVDTGIRKGTDLANTCFAVGKDFVNNDSDPIDDNGHGTHVAGTIAQSTNNGVGVAGVAYNSCLMPVKVLGATGSGTYANVALGIRYAADNEAKVINLSLGGSATSTAMEDALAYAYSKGVTIVAAIGNDNQATAIYPAGYDDYVIAVGATQYDETKAPYSNYGQSLDLVAPGGNTSLDQNKDGYPDGVLQQTFTITGAKITWGYYFFQGTSMASPHVAGVAALVIAKGVTGPDNVRAALETTAEEKGTASWDEIYGWGLVDAAAALTYVPPVPPPTDNPPTVNIANPLDGATVSGLVSIEASATDDVGVAQVGFYAGATLIGTDTTSPYSVSWDSTIVADGTYTLTTTAIDTASQTASDSITVNVDNYNNPPVANAGPDQTVSDADGTGSETVILDGSTSYDSDGTISSYEWTEGATLLGTTAQITYDFTVGTHTVTLTVTDNDGATGSDDVIVTVSPNQAPIANTGPDQSAYVGATVNFDGSGSSDPDGIIVSYVWDFGDGTSGTGVTTSYVYTVAGIYTVTLVVTDNGGLTGSDTAVVTISEAPVSPIMYVGDIAMSGSCIYRGPNPWCKAQAIVSILDSSGVSGATVSGSWSGAYSATVSGTTGSDGQVIFVTNSVKGGGKFTFTVNNVTKEGWLYDSGTNVETWDSITLP